MTETHATSRRAFLKTGAILAAPVAAVAPVAALADDGSRARLARLEDERAIERLHRSLMKKLNGGDCTELRLAAEAVELDPALRSIAEDLGHDAEVQLADDGLTAHARHACRVELDCDFDGETTVERMARFQGHGSHRHSEAQVLVTDYKKTGEGWTISRVSMA